MKGGTELLQGAVFLGLASHAVVLTTLAIVRTGAVRLESPIGRRRDGIPLGKMAPTWEMTDTRGSVHSCPSRSWQLLFFLDRSIVEFPGLVKGMESLVSDPQEPEVLVMTRGENADSLSQALDDRIPIILVSPAFLSTYEIRVTPFVTIIAPDGMVRMNGIVNYESTLSKMWREARANLPIARGVRV